MGLKFFSDQGLQVQGGGSDFRDQGLEFETWGVMATRPWVHQCEECSLKFRPLEGVPVCFRVFYRAGNGKLLQGSLAEIHTV